MPRNGNPENNMMKVVLQNGIVEWRFIDFIDSQAACRPVPVLRENEVICWIVSDERPHIIKNAR